MEDSEATLAGGDFSHRIDDIGSHRTELGRLRSSLNMMLTQIEKAFSETEQSQAQLRRFVADASHELRTPLTSIRGYAELYRRGIARNGDALDASMRRIESESGRMTALVEDMLTLARMDQRRNVERQPVDLAAVVFDAVGDFRVVDERRPVDVTFGASPWVLGDPHELMQVITNLLANARVHTPSETPVEVTVDEVPDGDGVLARVIVRDHGPGIDGAEQTHLFEPFYRTDPARTRANGGAGLGLTIAAGIVQAHHGTVTVDSALGAGAAFTITIPTIAADAAVVDAETLHRDS